MRPRANLFRNSQVGQQLTPVLTLLIRRIQQNASHNTLNRTFQVPPRVKSYQVRTSNRVHSSTSLRANLTDNLLHHIRLVNNSPLGPTMRLGNIQRLLARLHSFFKVAIMFTRPVVNIIKKDSPLIMTRTPNNMKFSLISTFNRMAIRFNLTDLNSTNLMSSPRHVLLSTPRNITVSRPHIIVRRFSLLIRHVSFDPILVKRHRVFQRKLQASMTRVSRATKGQRVQQ